MKTALTFLLVGALLPGMAAAQGEIWGWGRQVVVGESAVTDLTEVAAGFIHSVGLNAEGSVVAWGDNTYGQCNVPEPNTDFAAVSAGWYHSLGRKTDGSIVAWGLNNYGQCTVPAPNADFVKIAGGSYHSLGLKTDGSIIAWGRNQSGPMQRAGAERGFRGGGGGRGIQPGPEV